MPWRLPRWAYSTLPVPVILKRFLAPDLVLILGIWLSFRPRPSCAAFGQTPGQPDAARLSVLIEHFTVATAALSAGRRKAGVMAEARGEYNRGRRALRTLSKLTAPISG